MKRILAIGAFERDNFGDLLFLRVLRDFMGDKGVEITPASIIFSDMRRVNGEIVYPYDLMLNLYVWDAIWIVGGEIGGVGITGAVLMDSIGTAGQHYGVLNESDKAAYDSLLRIPRGDHLSAYIPNLSGYPKNRNTPMIVNSVGLSNSTLDRGMLKSETATLSRSIVSVREGKSARFCEEYGIPHLLAPDVVTALSHFRPLQTPHTGSSYVVVQVNRELLSQTKLAKFAKDLKYIGEYLGAEVVLLRAGVTFGHDDNTLYQQIIGKYKSLKPKHKIVQYEDRDPLQIAELIARSRLCVATSLHCRIVSESYGVPCISLSNKKVANYASTWEEDDQSPYDVEASQLVNVVVKMKDRIDNPIRNGNLSKKALENLERLYEMAVSRAKNITSSAESLENERGLFVEYAKDQKDILDTVFTGLVSEREMHVRRAQELVDYAQELKDQVTQLRSLVHNLRSSRSYKIGRVVTAPYRLSRRLAFRTVHQLKQVKTSHGKDK